MFQAYIKELKSLVYKYLFENNTKVWIDRIYDFQNSHNNR